MEQPTTAEHSAARVDRARVAVGVVFTLNGLAFASWAARVPAIRGALDLSAGGVALLLLCVSSGALVALPLSGALVARVGASRAVVGGVLTVVLGSLTMALGLATATAALVGAGLFVLGLGTSTWDVAMNIEAADVERRLGRTIMPRFHAGFSLGTVLGAGVGSGCAAIDVPLQVQLLLTTPVVLGAVLAARAFLPVTAPPDDGTAPAGPRPSALSAWREPHTLLLGVMVLAFALCEGIANDWLALALVDGYDATEALGAAVFGVFVAAMTLGRLVGGTVVDRLGRVVVLRVSAAVVAAGALAVVVSPGLPGAVAGAALWGVGASLGFPLGMSAAADDPAHAAVRVSVVGSIGYCAFLGGPPLVGLVAEGSGVRSALVVVVAAALVGLLTSSASRSRREPAAAAQA
ncbi:MFS transporter [Modestobacter sp. I12A-02628]|uniref:MFS transporter n=1 Tax=Goekera deserti TaxID=2497753 RepID=A0A7K3WFJ4_9ACTN|nr:MFS transporter [Goekera deserti]MPR00046.1 MFS transporter [Goekera deserti]NDI49825.1 MFS transporter [Goekera deserti]NEL55187.1 MFS transporter [Goekera deserti]